MAAGFDPERSRVVASIASVFLVVMAAVVWSLYDGILDSFRSADFNFLHTAGALAWEGRFVEAYSPAGLDPSAVTGAPAAERPLLFTYPPPVGFVVGPLGALPRDTAYATFIAATGFLFLATVARLASGYLAAVLMAGLPILTVSVLNGQTSLLTGALAALVCLGHARSSRWAGAPLGLMIVKPHTAPVLALLLVLDRRWPALAIAAATFAAAAVAAGAAFGPEIWQAFVGAGGATAELLRDGRLPIHRMITPYALAETAGASVPLALAAQGAAALAAGWIIWRATRRPAKPRVRAGLAALLAPAFSPYFYDYDLTICLAGLACLWPDLTARSRLPERAVLIASFWLTTFPVFAAPFRAAGSSSTETEIAVGAVFYLVAAAHVVSILRRPDRRHAC